MTIDKRTEASVMAEIKLGFVESHFADIIWKNAPLTTKKLVELCAAELNWKRTTTYTVLKKLCQRGLFTTNDGVITVLLSKEEFYAIRSEEFLNQTFSGSLPTFIAAFTTRKTLTPEELDEIKRLVDSL